MIKPSIHFDKRIGDQLDVFFFCIFILAVRAWAEDRSIPRPYWKWIALGAWVFLVGFTLAFTGTSFGEGEPAAAVRGGILFGIIAVIAGAGLWRLLKIGTEPGEEELATETEE